MSIDYEMRHLFQHIATKYRLNMIPVKIHFPRLQQAKQFARKHNKPLEWRPDEKKWYCRECDAHHFKLVIVNGKKRLQCELI